MAASADLNATCELLRLLSVSTAYRDDNPVNSTSGQLTGFDSAKYLLREVVNPALCVMELTVTCTHLNVPGLKVY